MLNFLKKALMLSLLLVCFGVFYNNPTYSKDFEKDGEVVMIALPDDRGGLKYYKDSKARGFYEKIKCNESICNEEKFYTPDDSKKNEPAAMGPFHYRYRFVKISSGSRWGASRRISSYFANETSIMQNIPISVSISQSWEISKLPSERLYEAFKAEVDPNWTSSGDFFENFELSVEPNKMVWIEYIPLIRYVSGYVQRYYVPRGTGNKKAMVVESRYIHSTSPKKLYSIFSKGEKLYGVCVWKQKNIK